MFLETVIWPSLNRYANTLRTAAFRIPAVEHRCANLAEDIDCHTTVNGDDKHCMLCCYNMKLEKRKIFDVLLVINPLQHCGIRSLHFEVFSAIQV